MIGVRQLAAMKEEAWIVNVAWGSLVDTDALVEALAADAIGGAALDVTDPGQLADGHPLWAEPRSLITPHSAKPTRRFSPRPGEARREENVARFAAGRELIGVVDVKVGY